MDGIRLLRYGTPVPVIYATPSLWTILMLNSQLPHESYRVYFANIVILYNDWWQRRDLKWSLIHSYKSRLLADHGSNFGEFACQPSKLQKSSHAHLFQVIKLSRKKGSQKWATVISFLFMFYYIYFFFQYVIFTKCFIKCIYIHVCHYEHKFHIHFFQTNGDKKHLFRKCV